MSNVTEFTPCGYMRVYDLKDINDAPASAPATDRSTFFYLRAQVTNTFCDSGLKGIILKIPRKNYFTLEYATPSKIYKDFNTTTLSTVVDPTLSSWMDESNNFNKLEIQKKVKHYELKGDKLYTNFIQSYIENSYNNWIKSNPGKIYPLAIPTSLTQTQKFQTGGGKKTKRKRTRRKRQKGGNFNRKETAKIRKELKKFKFSKKEENTLMAELNKTATELSKDDGDIQIVGQLNAIRKMKKNEEEKKEDVRQFVASSVEEFGGQDRTNREYSSQGTISNSSQNSHLHH